MGLLVSMGQTWWQGMMNRIIVCILNVKVLTLLELLVTPKHRVKGWLQRTSLIACNGDIMESFTLDQNLPDFLIAPSFLVGYVSFQSLLSLFPL